MAVRIEDGGKRVRRKGGVGSKPRGGGGGRRGGNEGEGVWGRRS